MSTNKDTYEQALKDAAVALDALAERAFHAAESFSINSVGYDDYNAAAHRTAVDRHSGICAAVLEVYGLLDQHRQAGAA